MGYIHIMKQLLGIRFSEYGQVLTCLYDPVDGLAPLLQGQAIMADLEYGCSVGYVVWQRGLDDVSEFISSPTFSPVLDEDQDMEEEGLGAAPKPRPRPSKAKPEGEGIAQLPVVRPATEEEQTQATENGELCRDAHKFCRRCIKERELDMKLVDVEILFDRSKMIFYFTAPTRIDFRELVKDLVRQYRTRIELRQIGVRHETQMLGALGNCGMVCCCRRYLRKFAPVTIKMAKEQNLFLNPAKISGICGRLLCCLSFEQENYDEFHRNCPKLGKRYQTQRGPMRVLRGNMFRNSIVVLPDGGQEMEITLDEWKDIEPQRVETAASGPKEARPLPFPTEAGTVSDTPPMDGEILQEVPEAESTARAPGTKPKRRRRRGSGEAKKQD